MLTVPITPVSNPLLVLSLTMYGEARGEGYDGVRAVGHVVMNRLASKHYPDSIVGVCLQHAAFSCWLDSEENRHNQHAMLQAMALPGKDWMVTVAAATAVLAGISLDLTTGATLYHASSMDPKPSWASSPKVSACGTIGKQSFYKELFS